MVSYLALVQEVTSRLKGLSITHIRREDNTQADRLAWLVSSSKSDLQGIRVKYLSEPSVSSPDYIEVDPVDVEPNWIDLILTYLNTGGLLTSKSKARRVKFWAVRYHVINGVLYKRGHTLPYLWCIHSNHVSGVLQEIYKGVCGNHVGGRVLSRKALLQDYYWPTIARDL